jgi:hypothetical protein
MTDALDRARLRGAAARARLIEQEGGTLTAAEVARHLRVTPKAVRDRREAGRLLALDADQRGYRYPAWQFVPEGVLPGLEQVLAELHGLSPWTQLAFMLNGKGSLDGVSPLVALRAGHWRAAVEAARRYGEQGA